MHYCTRRPEAASLTGRRGRWSYTTQCCIMRILKYIYIYIDVREFVHIVVFVRFWYLQNGSLLCYCLNVCIGMVEWDVGGWQARRCAWSNCRLWSTHASIVTAARLSADFWILSSWFMQCRSSRNVAPLALHSMVSGWRDGSRKPEHALQSK